MVARTRKLCAATYLLPRPTLEQLGATSHMETSATPASTTASSTGQPVSPFAEADDGDHRDLPSLPTRRSSDLQQVSEIMRHMLTQAQPAGQYCTNDQIKEMTRKVSAEVDLVHQQTQNQRYGASHIGATAKDISNVVTDAASGVVDIFHGIDKAVADTWNNFWKDGKADGIGSNLSRK